MLYRKKPILVEVIKWNGDNFSDIEKFTNDNVRYHSYYEKNEYAESKTTLVIPTLEGDMIVSIGDYIIRGVKGEYYPCKPNIFEMTYELASTSSQTEINGSKGSDEYKYHEQRRGINVDSFQSEAPQKQDYIIKVTDVTSSQTEISDEEIEKWIEENYKPNYVRIFVWEGIKWYREQLKSRQ